MIKPIYIFSGFIDGGKTTVIKETLSDKEFTANSPSLIIAFEQGDVTYDEAFLTSSNSKIIYLDKIEDLTKEKMQELEDSYKFERVVIELNGMQKDEDLYKQGFHSNWEVAESLAIFDSTSFMNYLANMKTFVFDHIRYSDVAIFNRSDNIDKRYIRNNLKACNPRIQIIFEDSLGNVSDGIDQSFFDTSGDELEISDHDYGLWFMDALDHPEKYDGKTISLHLACAEKLKEDNAAFMGRKAMVCCANDLTTIGLTVVGVDPDKMSIGNYYDIKGKLRLVSDTQGNPSCIMYAESLKASKNPEEELVYFN